MAYGFAGGSYFSTTSVPAGLNLNTAALTCSIWSFTTSTTNTNVFGSNSCYLAVTGSVNVPGVGGFRDHVGCESWDGDNNYWVGCYAGDYTQLVEYNIQAVPTNAWVHYAMTWSGTSIQGYINGVATGGPQGGTVATANAWARIVVGGFIGDAQDAVVYNRVLTATEILNLSRARDPRRISTSGLVGYWPLFGSDPTLDLSGNGRTLTATGTPTTTTRNAPVGWGGPGLRLVPAASGGTVAVVGSSSTPSTGVAALLQARALVGDSTTRSTGTAALLSTRPLVGTSSTANTGVGALVLGVGIAGTSSSPSTGVAALSVVTPAAGSSTTATTGSSTLLILQAIQATSTTATTGVAALSTGAPVTALVADSASTTVGTAALLQARALVAVGDARSSGTAALTATLPVASGGTVATSGIAALSSAWAPTASGVSQGSGTATLLSAQPVPGTSTSRTSGIAALLIGQSLVASADTPTTGAASVSGTTPPAPGSGPSIGYDSRRFGRQGRR